MLIGLFCNKKFDKVWISLDLVTYEFCHTLYKKLLASGLMLSLKRWSLKNTNKRFDINRLQTSCSFKFIWFQKIQNISIITILIIQKFWDQTFTRRYNTISHQDNTFLSPENGHKLTIVSLDLLLPWLLTHV